MSSYRRTIRAIFVATVIAAGGAGAAAEVASAAQPSSVDILFERKHLTNVNAGTDLVYKFDRSVSSPELLGQPFADEIKVEVKKVATDGTRSVVVKVFSGERARDAHAIDDLTGNPVLVVFLDRAIASYMSVAGGKVSYLKDKFRTAMRERATVDPVKVKLGDKIIDGYRVSVAPYSGDLNAAKMRGYENSKFSFIVCDSVPGQFVELLATYENTAKGAPRLEERTLMVGAEVLK
ncbi:MAG: hypothetical protein ABL901_01325 [Hyphomicrobiaceae bacterium]